MKSHKNQPLVSLLSPLISLVKLRTRGHTMVSGVQTPSQCPDTELSLEKCAYKPLRIKRFHGASAGNQHPYLLKSRYGIVRISHSKVHTTGKRGCTSCQRCHDWAVGIRRTSESVSEALEREEKWESSSHAAGERSEHALGYRMIKVRDTLAECWTPPANA